MKLSKSNTAVLLTTVELLKAERDAERALADELAADVERYVGLTGALARWKEAREQ